MLYGLNYFELDSPMSVASNFLRFLLEQYRSISPLTIIAADDEDDDYPFRYQDLYQTLTDTEEERGLDLQYPRRLLLLAGHPSLCLPEVLRDLNYSARRGALFLFHHHHPNSFEDPLISIFWRIRDGPGSKELIRAIIGFL